MELRVNDYVRTKDYQNIRSRIGKIIRQDGKYYYLDIDEDTQMVWEKDTILKSSPNIIDLIEVGDYVNGYLVIEKDINNELRYIDLKDRNMKYVKYLDIKSIVTKEQFSCMEYKIGE